MQWLYIFSWRQLYIREFRHFVSLWFLFPVNGSITRVLLSCLPFCYIQYVCVCVCVWVCVCVCDRCTLQPLYPTVRNIHIRTLVGPRFCFECRVWHFPFAYLQFFLFFLFLPHCGCGMYILWPVFFVFWFVC